MRITFNWLLASPGPAVNEAVRAAADGGHQVGQSCRQPAASPRLSGVRHVVFRLEKDRYALPLSAIKEVVTTPERFTRVPRAPPSLRGVMNLRGRVVPVVDLRVLLQVQPAGAPASKVVLLDRGRRELGLLITDVDGIESIEKVTSAGAGSGATVRGLARLGALAITVLDPDGLDAAVAHAFATR